MVKRIVFLFLLFILAFLTENPQARKLRVQGSRIIDQDGNTLVLKGVNLPGLEWDQSPGNNNITRETVNHISDDWGANVIRLPLNQDWYLNSENYRNVVRNVHRWCTEKGMYLILDLHWVDANGQTQLPNNLSNSFWQAVARDYLNADNVIYDIFNEPYGVSYGQWVNTANNLMQAVRTVDQSAIFLIKGIDWGFSHNGQMTWDASDNVIYGSHPYPNKTDNNGYRFLTGHRPILLSEFGYWTSGQQAPSGLSGGGPQYITELLNHSNSNGISYAAWCFHDESTPNLLSNRNTYARTAYGDQMRSDIRGSTLRSFEDRTPLLVENVTGESNKIRVVFSKNLDRQTAVSTSNYSVSGYAVTSVAAPSYGDYVVLTLDRNLNYSTPASVSVSNVRDITTGNNAVESASHSIEYQTYSNNFFVDVGAEDEPFEDGFSKSGYKLDDDIINGVYSAGTYIDRTGDREIDDSFIIYPWGITGYKVNVHDNGNYRVLLAFYDQTGLGSRDTNSLVFDLVVNGQTIAEDINYFLSSQAFERPRKPFFIRFDVEVSDNVIDIDFETTTGRVFLASVRVEKDPSGYYNGYIDYGVLTNETVPVMQSAIEVSQQNITIYPNPFNPVFNISLGNSFRGETVTANIYNIKGDMVSKREIDASSMNTVSWSLDGLPSGVYMLRLNSKQQTKNFKLMYLK